MEVREIDGDILQSKCDVICHQVNCQAVMGSGVARAIRQRYPLVYEQYSNFLNNNTIFVNGVRQNTESFLGLCQIVKVGNNKYVANLFGQDHFGRDKQHTDYNAFLISLYNLRRLVLFGGYGIRSIAFPYSIGCGLGGGDWNLIYEMIKDVFKDTNLVIEIVKFNKNN